MADQNAAPASAPAIHPPIREVDDLLDLVRGARAIAAALGVSHRTALDWIHRRLVPTFRIGGSVCARRSTLARWLAEREAAAMESERSGAAKGCA
jgi:excisionase family DNA binding protein